MVDAYTGDFGDFGDVVDEDDDFEAADGRYNIDDLDYESEDDLDDASRSYDAADYCNVDCCFGNVILNRQMIDPLFLYPGCCFDGVKNGSRIDALLHGVDCCFEDARFYCSKIETLLHVSDYSQNVKFYRTRVVRLPDAL